MKAALQLSTFRYGDPPAPRLGLRIGTTRFPPRGVRKERWGESFDVWFPVLAPSKALLARRPFAYEAYAREIEGRAESRQAVELLAHLSLRTPISVGCYCAEETHCHRTYLRQLIDRAAERLP